MHVCRYYKLYTHIVGFCVQSAEQHKTHANSFPKTEFQVLSHSGFCYLFCVYVPTWSRFDCINRPHFIFKLQKMKSIFILDADYNMRKYSRKSLIVVVISFYFDSFVNLLKRKKVIAFRIGCPYAMEKCHFKTKGDNDKKRHANPTLQVWKSVRTILHIAHKPNVL